MGAVNDMRRSKTAAGLGLIGQDSIKQYHSRAGMMPSQTTLDQTKFGSIKEPDKLT